MVCENKITLVIFVLKRRYYANLFRTVTRRMESCEGLEDILASYPKLTDSQKQMIRDALSE